jgi:hypothetical protein
MNLRCPNGTGLPCFVKGVLVSVLFYGLCSKNSKSQPLFDGGQLLRDTVAVQMCSFINLLEQKVFEKQPTVGVEKKVTNYWDMLPTELHVAILKMHHQETMLFHTRGWIFMKTVSGWQRIQN